MRNLLEELGEDECGIVITGELVVVVTIAMIGVITGTTVLQTAKSAENADRATPGTTSDRHDDAFDSVHRVIGATPGPSRSGGRGTRSETTTSSNDTLQQPNAVAPLSGASVTTEPLSRWGPVSEPHAACPGQCEHCDSAVISHSDVADVNSPCFPGCRPGFPTHGVLLSRCSDVQCADGSQHVPLWTPDRPGSCTSCGPNGRPSYREVVIATGVPGMHVSEWRSEFTGLTLSDEQRPGLSTRGNTSPGTHSCATCIADTILMPKRPYINIPDSVW